MKIVAVMPAFQEEPRIAEAIFGVKKHIPTVIVVDDGSRDQTAARARSAGAVVIRHAINRGQGAALKTGELAAERLGAQIVVHVDADGQHDPEFLTQLVTPILRGEADVVLGSRFLGINPDGMPRSRRWLMRGIRLFNAYALGIPRTVTDPQSGLRALTIDASRRIAFTQDRYAHASEILKLVTRSTLRWKEVPARVRYSADSLAKGQKATNAFKIVWQLFIGSLRK